MLILLFWLSLLLLLYIYLGYPLLVYLWGQQPRTIEQDEEDLPHVSILIAAYNEAKDIETTLRNKLALDYPADRLEILVVSDESEDGTDDIVRSVAADSASPIRLFRQAPRQGKTAGLNRIVPEAKGDIIAFSDANSEWDAAALRKLVRNFADPQVGYVTGKMVYVNDAGHLVGDGCSAYMKYENWLRHQETRVGSIVGVDGGIDAMRRSLYQPLRPDQLPDFVQPLKVVEQGQRVVYEPEALLREEALQDGASEFSMRVRVTLRALWALRDMRVLLNPLRFGRFAIQLLSHKVLRYLAFVPQIVLTVSAVLLANRGGIYGLCLLGLIAMYLFAWLGQRRERDGRNLPFYMAAPYYLMLLNMACYQATRAFMRGEKKVIWNPRKG